MDAPICLSQYFVNKQNVRSYRNINKNRLKTQDEFLKKFFRPEESLTTFLTEEFRSLLSELKTKTKMTSKDDFKTLFSTEDKKLNLQAVTNLQTVNKAVIFEKCWKAINDIVPKKIIGSNQNEKTFRSLIHTVVYSMRREHIVLVKFIEKWNFSMSPWLNISNDDSKKILYYILLWIVKNILSAMICLNFYVTTCKVDVDENKLHYFWKFQWQSFYDKKISNLMFTKVIKKCELLCLGKKLKRNHSPSQRLKLKCLKKEIPKLHLILKNNNDCRPIVRYKNGSQTQTEKYKMKKRTKFLKSLTTKPSINIENEYVTLHEKWLASNKSKLYFVKTDLSNAFGSVNKDKLLKILSERHIHFQKTEKNIMLKKRMAQQYRETMDELRKPLLIRAGSTIFEWLDGLVQGYKYSPALSELYYGHMDNIYFSNHLKKSETQIKLFTRVVDDYLYITDSLDDAYVFLNTLSNYRNINYGKTVVNFKHPNIQFSNEITFLGYSYNTENLEVSRAANVFVGQMCYKIAFTGAISNIEKFLKNRIGQTGIQINGHIFNFLHNPEELIWRHIFTTFCLSANKFCTILAILCDEREMANYLKIYKKRVVVKLGNSILDTLLRNKPANHPFFYCINHFQHLAWKAVYLCSKGTLKCSGLIPHIKGELAKTNCLFGKWREHASAIHSNGEPIRAAVREICRRSYLKTIFKIFEELPEGFQCYNHRKFYSTVNKAK